MLKTVCKFSKTILVIIFVFITGLSAQVKAQTIELLAGNTFNGAMNGVIMGGATMALQNTDDFDPVRIGAGIGTLYGLGVGIYDVSSISKGDQFYISGTFNDGTNTSILVLLDTFYGAAAGAVVSTSVSLIAQAPILESLQYGTGAGAWAGFGFGLVDAFILAQGPHSAYKTAPSSSGQASADGLIKYSSKNHRLEMALINPKVSTLKKISANGITLDHSLGLQVVNINISL